MPHPASTKPEVCLVLREHARKREYGGREREPAARRQAPGNLLVAAGLLFAVLVTVVVAHPRHGEGEPFFTATLRCQIEEVVYAEQAVEPPGVSRVGVIDPARRLLEQTGPWSFIGREHLFLVVVIH